MSFHDVACLATEERKSIVDVIVQIKKQEKSEIDRASKGSSQNVSPPPNLNSIKAATPSRFSSLNKNWSNPKPNIPRR